jgi:GTP-binding protein HflX
MTPQPFLPGSPAILVQIAFDHTDQEGYIAEFKELVLSAKLKPVEFVLANRKVPDAKYYLGSGKAQEIAEMVLTHCAHQVLINHTLSPSQKRNLEELFKCSVIDRTELILHIFALRARTFEGKLQVELAQLQYMSTRLVRGWTHLERQKGGIGLRGGPGEKQLEVDRRLLRQRIKTINQRLETVHKQRNLGRRARQRADIPCVSVIGYTNAGKSTLFNRLTRSDVYVADQLFATLDPTLRRISFPQTGTIILADTVGFIRDLPHDLVNAFHATLEETLQATLLLHVIDAHHPDRQNYIDEVQKVLVQIGADKVRQLQVFNKLDLLPSQAPRIDRDEDGFPIRVWLSATTGAGLPLLHQALGEIQGKRI